MGTSGRFPEIASIVHARHFRYDQIDNCEAEFLVISAKEYKGCFRVQMEELAEALISLHFFNNLINRRFMINR